MFITLEKNESELLGVFNSSAGCRVETKDTDGELIEVVFIEEHQDQNNEGIIMPAYVNTGYGYHKMPKSNALPINAKIGQDYEPTLGQYREYDNDPRTIPSWTFITDRFHPELMMNQRTTWNYLEAWLSNPNMTICKNCNLQISKYLECSWCNLGK